MATNKAIPEFMKIIPSDQYGGVTLPIEEMMLKVKRKSLENQKDAPKKYPGLNVSSKVEVTIGTEVDSVEEEEEER